MHRRIAIGFACAASLAFAAMPALAPAKGNKGKGHKGPHHCHGTLTAPGVLSGTFKHGVVVDGACAVNAGPTHVFGLLRLTADSVLLAAFGQHDSSLTVTGNVLVGHGATLVLGCNPKSSPCIDDSQTNPTLTSAGKISGNLIATHALGVLVHTTEIGGNFIEVGGGGGLSCKPPSTGPFSQFQSPVFSALEDATVHGNVEVKGLKTCWAGVNRVHARRNVLILHNILADPDGVELLSNDVHRNLVCRKNGHPSGMPPGTQPVWDSGDISPTGALYPRAPHPNAVHGKRIGQCKLASPATLGGPLGPGPF